MANWMGASLDAKLRDGGDQAEDPDVINQSFSLPEGWSTQWAAECFDQISTNGIKVKTKECQANGLYPVVDQGQEFISGYISDSEKLIKLDSPVIIFGDHTRSIKWVDFDFVPGADGTKILAPKKYLFPRLAYYGLKNLEIPDKGYSRHFKFLKELKVTIPPLAEQKIIADKLDTLLTQVETTKLRLERIFEVLKKFRQSILAAAVSGKLTEEWRGNIEASWTKSILANVCRSVSDGDHQAPPKADAGIPFLVISNVSNGEVDFDSVSRWVPEDYYESLKNIRKAEVNDILYTVTGSFGIPVVVKSSAPFCFQRHIAIIKPDHSSVDYRYLYYYLASPEVFKHADSVATGTAQKTVSLTHLRNFSISLPTLEEQAEIVRRVEEFFVFAYSIEQKASVALARVNNLTQSILAKAFRGELTAEWRAVNPDLISGENSAETLLMKIQASRKIKQHRSKK